MVELIEQARGEVLQLALVALHLDLVAILDDIEEDQLSPGKSSGRNSSYSNLST